MRFQRGYLTLEQSPQASRCMASRRQHWCGFHLLERFIFLCSCQYFWLVCTILNVKHCLQHYIYYMEKKGATFSQNKNSAWTSEWMSLYPDLAKQSRGLSRTVSCEKKSLTGKVSWCCFLMTEPARSQRAQKQHRFKGKIPGMGTEG